MAKKVTGYLKIAGAGRCGESFAPDRTRLGQRGLNIMESARRQRQTQKEEKEHLYGGDHDLRRRSFTFEMKTPDVVLHQEAAKLTSGSKAPGRHRPVVTRAQVREIAEAKMKDLNCDTIEAAHEDGSRAQPVRWRRGCG